MEWKNSPILTTKSSSLTRIELPFRLLKKFTCLRLLKNARMQGPRNPEE
jgi:hypothetical protein